MILCALAYMSVGTHVPQLMWKSEDNPDVQLLQPSLWQGLSFVVHCCLAPGTSPIFSPLPSRGTLGTQAVPMHFFYVGFGSAHRSRGWVVKSLSIEAFPQPPQTFLCSVVYLHWIWLSPCIFFQNIFPYSTPSGSQPLMLGISGLTGVNTWLLICKERWLNPFGRYKNWGSLSRYWNFTSVDLLLIMRPPY